MNALSKKTLRALSNNGVTVLSTVAIPDNSSSMPWANASTGFSVDDNGTGRILTLAQVLARAADLYEVYNSEDGTTISDPRKGMNYKAALAFACDWNHSGAPNLFRVRTWSQPVAREHTGYNGFEAGTN